MEVNLYYIEQMETKHPQGASKQAEPVYYWQYLQQRWDKTWNHLKVCKSHPLSSCQFHPVFHLFLCPLIKSKPARPSSSRHYLFLDFVKLVFGVLQ